MSTADAFARARVAVLDDNRNFQALMRSMLRHLGFRRVEVFGDPGEALTHVTEVGVDLAFVGLVMPRQNGIDWVRTVRRRVGLANPDLAIVMVSGHAVRGVLDPAVAAGIDGFLVKPLSPDALARHARHVLCERAAYVSGPSGYWGPETDRTRLRLRQLAGDGRFAPAVDPARRPVPAAPRPERTRALPGFDVEIVDRTGYHGEPTFID